jgi:acyl carrier protein
LAIERQELLAVLEHEYRAIKRTGRSVRPDDRLRQDLGIDSLTAQELLAALEDRYGLALLGNPRLLKVRTVNDLVELLVAEGAAA